MPAIKYDKGFRGEVPKLNPEQLPPMNAQLAVNCNFVDGQLRPLKAGLLLTTLAANPVRGLYTEDGLLFYSWPVETLAFTSPVLDDAFNRMYFLQPSVGDFRAATKVAMSVLGPTPVTTYKVGVPRPTVAPALQVVERTTLPDYPSVTVSASAYWDYAGVAYSGAAVALTTVAAFKSYTFTAPALPGTPPATTPTLVCTLKFTDNVTGSTILTIITRAATIGRSNALPGTVEMAVTLSSANVATIDLSWGVADTIAYTYAYENQWNEQSAPAPPAIISRTYLQNVQATATAGVFTGYREFSKYNLYRTYGTNPDFIKCAESATTALTDSTRRATGLLGVLESTDYFPPVAGLEGMVLTPGGWFIAFKDRTLYKSAPFAPHAWPYSEVFSSEIRGVCVGSQSIVVTCADGVYLVSGSSPDRPGKIPLGAPQAGISQRSMTNADGTVIYASHDGMVLVEGSVASIEIGQKLFSREKWRELYGDIMDDASLRLAYHDGFVVGSSSTQPKGFLLRLDEDVGALTRTEVAYLATMRLPVADALYYTVGQSVYRFQGGADLTFDWWGKDWVFPHECSMGAGHLRGAGSVRVRIYADGVLLKDATLAPGGFRIEPKLAKVWSIRLTGTSPVKSIQIGQTMRELSNV